jgi:ATP-dependent DNA helicase RecQ
MRFGREYEEGLRWLRASTGDATAEFREGQWDAIEHLLRRAGPLLVVQKTGWGKSNVYFLATKLLREAGGGPALLVSPLLSLMRNQIAAAERIGLRAARITSEEKNREEWEPIQQRLHAGAVDVLMVSPERLGNETFMRETLIPIAHRISFLIVDEAHCISDWGHDFRPDYRRITRIIQNLPRTVALLATTATANDRVVEDLKQQIGPELTILRGEMARPSLRLQVLHMPGQAERLAWLAAAIPKLPGSGIVYCLTVRDAKNVSAWLKERGIQCEGYWGSLDEDEGEAGRRERVEEMLLKNEIKVLVATTALGMGYDKPDLGFVIHFQSPGSVVHYYQQVGRAGRAVEKAYAILLRGEEDREINDYFIYSAFPERNAVELILQKLKESPNGETMVDLQLSLNLSMGQISKALKLLALESPAPVIRDGNVWKATATELNADFWNRVERLTLLREQERREMERYAETRDCLMMFLTRALDDPSSKKCGHCANCVGRTVTREIYEREDLTTAVGFLRLTHYAIELKKQWPRDAFRAYPFAGKIKPEDSGKEGRVLCEWGDAGWGELVRRGKYQDERFADELVEGLAEMIARWGPEPAPKWIVPVPSLRRGDLVSDLAERLAARTGLRYRGAVRKVKETAPQKEMLNRFQQARNLDGAFEVEKWERMEEPIILLDDMVDSMWTFTVICALLRRAGGGPVFPVALALSRGSEEG